MNDKCSMVLLRLLSWLLGQPLASKLTLFSTRAF